MKNIFICLCLAIGCPSKSQNEIQINLIDKETFSCEEFFGIDRFNSIYYLKNQAFEKDVNGETQSYSNLQLGKIDQVHIFNPLKIPVLHKNFNSIVLLDNRMSEIKIINFNELTPYRRVTNVAYANDSSLWLFNSISQQLELFDYLAEKTKLKTLPLNQEIISVESDYNNVYVLTPSRFLHYNYTGSLISELNHEGFNKFKLGSDFIIFQKQNSLFYKLISDNYLKPLKTHKKTIKQFFVIDQTLYIYDGKFLYHYQLLKN